LTQNAPAKTLRRLRLHDIFPWNRGRNDGAAGRALHLLNGIHSRQPYDRRPIFFYRVDRSIDGRGIDQRPHRIMNQNDVTVGCGERLEGLAHRLLPGISPFDHLHPRA
jgi:hypothetical protein